MSEPQSERPVVGDYRLEVTDFGPIVRASVDLRPLTVFIGPSNTGKSYLATLIYALHRTLYQRFSPTQYQDVALNPQLEEEVLGWVHRAKSSKTLPEVPHSLNKELSHKLEDPLDRPFLRAEMEWCFDLSAPAEIVRRSSRAKRASIVLSFPYGSEEQAVQYKVWLRKAPSVEGQVSSKGQISNQIDLSDFVTQVPPIKDGNVLDMGDSSYRTHPVKAIVLNLLNQVSSVLLAPVLGEVYYLPADRSGVLGINKGIVRSIIRNAARVTSADTRLLPGVLADFLERLVSMPAESSQYQEHAERLEHRILQGTVRTVRTATDYPEFLYRPEEWNGKDDLPLMRTSSMVSELAPVVLYLRYLVQPGDVLIIEEPESHLHPAMQAVFARELARLVRFGIRVVVTTHSEWLLDQFANLVRLSGLPEDKRKEFPGADEALQPEQFGAWLFKQKQRPKGSVVEEIRVDPDAGGLLTDYGDIAEQLYNEWVEIGNRITESGK